MIKYKVGFTTTYIDYILKFFLPNFITTFLGEIKSRKFVDREGTGSSEFNLVVRAGNDFCGVNSTDPKGMLHICIFLHY